MARAALSYGMPWTCEGRWQYRMYDPPIQFVRIVIPFFPRPARASIATCFYSPTYFLVLLFLLASLPAVPIRRNLIGNQSFWGKNGAWLSVTVPWVFAAERGVQKRLCAGTVVGKVNAADSLSSALFQKEKRKKASLGFFFPTDKVFSLQFHKTIRSQPNKQSVWSPTSLLPTCHCQCSRWLPCPSELRCCCHTSCLCMMTYYDDTKDISSCLNPNESIKNVLLSISLNSWTTIVGKYHGDHKWYHSVSKS